MTQRFEKQQSEYKQCSKAISSNCFPVMGTAVALLWCSGVSAQSATVASADQEQSLQEVVVTASRREESLSKVPISVQAFDQEQMDAQGLKSLDDVVRYTPGLTLTRSGFTGANQISIRGISSSAGAGTTGIYIDDTPIQVRNLGYGAASAFPGLFDLQRVEILRGPQGTLFGAGSEGGTVRFIQAEPSLNNYSSYARAEGANTENGGPSYEAGAAVGGPIVDDRLGFRASVFYRRDGGYIDAVNGTYRILNPTGADYGNSVAFTPKNDVEDNVNWDTTTAVRLALKLAASDSLTITPAVFYQKQHNNDGLNTTYWLTQSNIGARQYTIPWYVAGNPATNPAFTAMNAPTNAQGDDAFTLTSLGINWNLGAVRLISNTSFFHRDQNQWADYTQGYVEFYQTALFPNGGYPSPGYKAMTDYLNSQRNFVEELRLQSDDADSRLNWVAGTFYSHNRQSAAQPIYVNFTQNASALGFGSDLANYAFPGGAPYGPGSTALENYLGINNGPNSLDYYASWQTVEEQMAGFAQADFDITKQLKLTAGVRVSRNHLSYKASFSGPETNGNAPYGLPCLPNTYCATPADVVTPGQYAVGTGPFAPVFPARIANPRRLRPRRSSVCRIKSMTRTWFMQARPRAFAPPALPCACRVYASQIWPITAMSMRKENPPNPSHTDRILSGVMKWGRRTACLTVDWCWTAAYIRSAGTTFRPTYSCQAAATISSPIWPTRHRRASTWHFKQSRWRHSRWVAQSATTARRSMETLDRRRVF